MISTHRTTTAAVILSLAAAGAPTASAAVSGTTPANDGQPTARQRLQPSRQVDDSRHHAGERPAGGRSNPDPAERV